MSYQIDNEENPPKDTPALVAYRLGRLEKAVDQINRHSIERDEKILDKLEFLGALTERVGRNEWRLDSLETSRTKQYQFLTAIALAVTAVIIELIFNLI